MPLVSLVDACSISPQSNQIKCATIFDSHEIEYRGRPNTFNREQRDDCAREEEGREEMRARERQRATTREREILCGSLSLSYLVCVSRSIDDSHDSLRE